MCAVVPSPTVDVICGLLTAKLYPNELASGSSCCISFGSGGILFTPREFDEEQAEGQQRTGRNSSDIMVNLFILLRMWFPQMASVVCVLFRQLPFNAHPPWLYQSVTSLFQYAAFSYCSPIWAVFSYNLWIFTNPIWVRFPY